MKKLLSVAVCLAAVGGMFAQKAAVEQAKKLSGKADKLTEARSYINDAMQNPETQNDPQTYFIAGKIEWDAFDNGQTIKMINPDDPSANGVVLGDELLAGYGYFLKALPLDSLPNEKGQVKPKYAKDIVNKISGHYNDFFGAGADYFNAKNYPKAYEAFMIFGDLPETGLLNKSVIVDPAQVSTAYFNAGLSAYSGNLVDESAEAFRKARLAGYEQPECYIYEIACWQNIAQTDEARQAESQQHIMEVAKAGYEKFGVEQPVFVNNLINNYVIEGNFDGALAELDPIIAANPENPGLYGLRGFVYDRKGDDAASEADYRKAASLPDVDFETLKNVSKKLFRVGTTKLNEVEGSSPEANAARQEIKTNYFDAARQYAEQAGTMNPNDDDLLNIIESLDYAITTYFNN